MLPREIEPRKTMANPLVFLVFEKAHNSKLLQGERVKQFELMMGYLCESDRTPVSVFSKLQENFILSMIFLGY